MCSSTTRQIIRRRKSRVESDDPGRFDPERFSSKASAARSRFSYLTFGGGKRICIGAAFAPAEATVLLATLAQRYSLRVLLGHQVEPQGLITLRARHGMKMLLTARRSDKAQPTSQRQ
jgi:cytochrome P450